MRRKHPRILGSLRHPLPPQTPPSSVYPTSIRLFPSQPSTPQPSCHTNPLSVFYPTYFPPLKNTSYFPTFMIILPSSSCVDKLSSKHRALFKPSSYLSTLMTTSPKRAPLENCLVSLSHQEAGYLQSDWELRKNSPGTAPGIGEDRWDPTPLETCSDGTSHFQVTPGPAEDVTVYKAKTKHLGQDDSQVLHASHAAILGIK
ncbi:uncharacterized protein LOC121137866 [Mesocricetus auratus]|uniref:Uncharacterized protein LOC121137866 n=1 Tax=Mesocricetus auratus TaxID=10036 RepID=A0ABM2X1A2_MESAU|nr:uncharacterized protein LOC121137866 [Mesocricetus auratus]